MKIGYYFLATLMMATPLTVAVAQGGTAPDISVKESQQWAKDNNTPAKKMHRKTSKSKAMAPKAGAAAQSASPAAK